jgi:hypothetical protein
MSRTYLFTQRSADVIMKRVGITTPPSNTFRIIPNVVQQRISLWWAKSGTKPRQVSQPSAVGYIPSHYVEKSKSVHSNFFRFLSTLLTAYYGSKAREVLTRLLEEYVWGYP